MTKPTIHMNGTAAEDLLEETLASAHALAHAKATLNRFGPNGRDYYPQGPDAIGKAILEHGLRIIKIDEVLKELNELAEYLSDEVARERDCWLGRREKARV